MESKTLVGTAVDMKFPLGTEGGGWRFTVKGVGDNTADLQQDTAVDVLSATFNDLERGLYVGTFQRLDADSQPIGPVASKNFEIVEDVETITLAVAADLSVA